MLKVSNLVLSRGAKSITNGLTFQLKQGQVLKVSGANGAGKSSLAMAIAGDISIASGEIESAGKIGYLMQNLEIDFPITVREFIQLAKPGAEIQDILTRFKIAEIADKKITQISLGQLQRAEFAQVLLQDPDLFILDEPLSAQDSESTEIILNVIRELKNSGKSLILISHIGSQLSELIDLEINLD